MCYEIKSRPVAIVGVPLERMIPGVTAHSASKICRLFCNNRVSLLHICINSKHAKAYLEDCDQWQDFRDERRNLRIRIENVRPTFTERNDDSPKVHIE